MKRESHLLVVYAGCCISLLAACGRPDPNDPAEVKRGFIQSVNNAIEKAGPGLKKPVTKISPVDHEPHTYSAEYTGKFTYDIRKTDSIVTPYIGSVSWIIRWYHNGVDTGTPHTLEAHYAYQGGKWVIKDLVHNAMPNEPTLVGAAAQLKNLPADDYLPLFGLPTTSD